MSPGFYLGDSSRFFFLKLVLINPFHIPFEYEYYSKISFGDSVFGSICNLYDGFFLIFCMIFVLGFFLGCLLGLVLDLLQKLLP